MYRQREGATSRTAVSSDSRLDIVMRWSDQCHLDCFKYSSSSVLGSVCSHFLEASSCDFARRNS